jgi:hypothetical protein
MESSGLHRHNSIDAATLRRLANSVEALGNIFYLLEMHLNHPEQIEHFLAIGKPALQELQDFVRREFNPIRLTNET